MKDETLKMTVKWTFVAQMAVDLCQPHENNNPVVAAWFAFELGRLAQQTGNDFGKPIADYYYNAIDSKLSYEERMAARSALLKFLQEVDDGQAKK